MKKLIVAALLIMGGICSSAGAVQAGVPRYESRGSAENARIECILPWYRFFGACDEAIEEAPDGRNWHGWNNHRHRNGRFRR